MYVYREKYTYIYIHIYNSYFSFLKRTMPDTEATVTVGIAHAAANPSQQGHWRERRSFLGFVPNFELDSQRKRKTEQPKSPETSVRLRLISKKSSRGLTTIYSTYTYVYNVAAGRAVHQEFPKHVSSI